MSCLYSIKAIYRPYILNEPSLLKFIEKGCNRLKSLNNNNMESKKFTKEDIGRYIYVSDKDFWMIGIIESETDEKQSFDGQYRCLATSISGGDGNNPPRQNNNSFWCYYTEGSRRYRNATQDEIDWLNACIKAEKYIPYEELHPQYLIFN